MEELVARKTNWGNVAETMNNVAGAVDSATNTAINIYRSVVLSMPLVKDD